MDRKELQEMTGISEGDSRKYRLKRLTERIEELTGDPARGALVPGEIEQPLIPLNSALDQVLSQRCNGK